ncbi:hypothetical protein [uncultured Flavobacterium sp.]|uniref:hypothetical protein n=1 Tax=uncultured Flavobacterium sp. TaxID=165435 RepID=UPI0025DEDB53|nr:hypothetical protein [uncultured Flavobacterium sp.]
MPVDEMINYSKRDKQTLERIETAKKSAEILKSFFEKGFKSFEALSSIVSNYYPEMSIEKLKNFWHFRHVDESMYGVLQDVFERLKSE